MSCKKPKFNICLLKQERFKSPTFNVGDLDLSNKTFVYKIKPKKAIGFKDYPTEIVDNLVYILPFDLPVGKYEHEFGFTDDKGYFVLFQGELEITNVASNKCTPCSANISVNDCNEVYNISYSENVIEINNSTLIYFEINENMELEQYESEPNIYDFELENGNLTLNFN